MSDPYDVVLESIRSAVQTEPPKVDREAAVHALIGMHIFALREILNELIAIRVREFGYLMADDEGELIALKQSFDFLCTDIRETRAKQMRQFRVVR